MSKIRLDLNRLLENKNTKGIGRALFYLLIGLLLIFVFVITFSSMNGKHIKTPVIETNIPADTGKNVIEVKVNNQNGRMYNNNIGEAHDIVNGEKTENNYK